MEIKGQAETSLTGNDHVQQQQQLPVNLCQVHIQYQQSISGHAHAHQHELQSIVHSQAGYTGVETRGSAGENLCNQFEIGVASMPSLVYHEYSNNFPSSSTEAVTKRTRTSASSRTSLVITQVEGGTGEQLCNQCEIDVPLAPHHDHALAMNRPSLVAEERRSRDAAKDEIQFEEGAGYLHLRHQFEMGVATQPPLVHHELAESYPLLAITFDRNNVLINSIPQTGHTQTQQKHRNIKYPSCIVIEGEQYMAMCPKFAILFQSL